MKRFFTIVRTAVLTIMRTINFRHLINLTTQSDQVNLKDRAFVDTVLWIYFYGYKCANRQREKNYNIKIITL